MSDELRQRATEFLKREAPTEVPHFPDPSVQRFLARYAVGEATFDEEQLEKLERCATEADAAAELVESGTSKAYFAECADIVLAVLEERAAGRS